MSLIVKICGLSTPETLDVALEAGADMVGFVFFPPSPRIWPRDGARAWTQVKGRALKVALTVDADDATLDNIIEALRPDILQLHGKETVARLRDIKQRFGAGDEGACRSKRQPISRAARLRGGRRTHPVRRARPKDATRPGGLGAPSTGCCSETSSSKLPYMVSGGLNAAMSPKPFA